MAVYSYHPDKIAQNGVDRMRFELGDTCVEMEALTSPLCDEEYTAVLKKEMDWQRAKLACLKAIVMKLSYEVDTSADGLSYSLSQRFDRWKAMLKEEEKKLTGVLATPRFCQNALNGRPYFYNDMHANKRRF